MEVCEVAIQPQLLATWFRLPTERGTVGRRGGTVYKKGKEGG